MAKIDALFRRMLELGASDIHLSSDSPPMWRINGDMVPERELDPINAATMKTLLYEITPPNKKEEFEATFDCDFAYELVGYARFRANLFMDRKGIGGVFRLIPSKIVTAEELQLPKAIIGMCNLPKGLILVTGATGSGKSTTLSAMVDYINRTRNSHIITIEDPIEFVHPNKLSLVNQREVHSHTESFKKALRAALREDPDIVLIGEMRDLETTEIAIETAETGHLVFATLHTATAATTVERIIQQYPGNKQAQIRMMLANSLKGVISQTLLKKADGTGRMAAMEILVSNFAIANLIREGKTHQIQSTMQTSARDGMVLLNDVLANYVRRGAVSREEALSKAVDKNALMNKIGAML